MSDLRSPKLIVLENDAHEIITISSSVSGGRQILNTSSPDRARAWLDTHSDVTAIIIGSTRQQAEAMSLLVYAAEHKPHVRRVLITSFDDLQSLVAGIHSGAVQHFVPRPCDSAELLAALGSDRPVGDGQPAR